MDIFDKVKKVTGEIAEKTVEITKVAVDKTKVGVDKAQTKRAIKEAYAKLGEAYYDDCNGISPKMEYDEYFYEINDGYAHLDELNSVEFDGVCQECGNENSLDAVYCSKCGAKMR